MIFAHVEPGKLTKHGRVL